MLYERINFPGRIVPETSTSFVVPVTVQFPLSGAAIDLYFANNQYYDGGVVADATGDLSISRASIGYVKNSNLTLTQFATNTLRIGTGTGLLIEDARTNELYGSDDFANVPGIWSTESGSTIPLNNQTNGPDGTLTGGHIAESANNGPHVLWNGLYNPPGNVRGSWTIYMKAAERTYGYLVAKSAGVSVYYTIVVDLSTGSITQTNNVSATNVVTSTEQMTDGWWRLRITMDTQTTGVSALEIGPSDRGTGNTFAVGRCSYQGDGSSGVYVWGAQLEWNAESPSSYFPTTTPAARAANVITNIGNLATAINAAAGSIVAQLNYGELTNIAANIVDSNGTNLLGFDSTNHGLSSITSTLTTTNTANRTTRDKIGISWDASGRSLVLNNGAVATDAVAQIPNATQHIGSNGTSNFIFAYVERLTVWTSRLTDTTLQGFTV